MQGKRIDIKKAVWTGVVILILGVFVYERTKVTSRVKNAAYTQGEVLRIEKIVKGSKYVKYSFSVDNKVYTGFEDIDFCKDCNYQCCESGAKVTVRYDAEDPSNNSLMK